MKLLDFRYLSCLLIRTAAAYAINLAAPLPKFAEVPFCICLHCLTESNRIPAIPPLLGVGHPWASIGIMGSSGARQHQKSSKLWQNS